MNCDLAFSIISSIASGFGFTSAKNLGERDSGIAANALRRHRCQQSLPINVNDDGPKSNTTLVVRDIIPSFFELDV